MLAVFCFCLVIDPPTHHSQSFLMCTSSSCKLICACPELPALVWAPIKVNMKPSHNCGRDEMDTFWNSGSGMTLPNW